MELINFHALNHFNINLLALIFKFISFVSLCFNQNRSNFFQFQTSLKGNTRKIYLCKYFCSILNNTLISCRECLQHEKLAELTIHWTFNTFSYKLRSGSFIHCTNIPLQLSPTKLNWAPFSTLSAQFSSRPLQKLILLTNSISRSLWRGVDV